MKEILSKIFGGAATNVADGLAGIVDKFVKTPEEKDAFEKEMTQLFMKHEADMEKNITERWRDIGPGRLGINTQDLGLEVENQEGIDNRIKKALEQKEWADSQPKIDEGIGTLVEDDLEEKTLQPQGLYSIIYGSNEV